MDVYSTGRRLKGHPIAKSGHLLLLRKCIFPTFLFLQCRALSCLRTTQWEGGKDNRSRGTVKWKWLTWVNLEGRTVNRRTCVWETLLKHHNNLCTDNGAVTSPQDPIGIPGKSLILRKLKSWSYQARQFDDRLSRFDTIQACDGQTDRRPAYINNVRSMTVTR